jgi:site-specific DNA-methyltransferase (adenine-specific)
MTNVLYYGDNLDVLRRHIPDESVDLVYLDPPFNSNADYNILFEEHGEKAAAQVQAFTDTWEWNTEARGAYEEIVEAGGGTADTMRAFRTMLGGSDMLAYLSMMAPRLIELRRVLKPTGSLYLHCDPTASHYLKLLLDSIFGPKNFRNEIIWWYRKWSRGERQFLRNHDVLLFYSKSSENKFNILRVPLAPSTLRRFGGKRQDFADDTRTRKITTDEESAGGFRPDVWPISLLPAQARERLGYPTQKPLALLRLVVEASSAPGEVVLDPFAGCGTTIDAAQEMGRRWIGIDITHLSIGLIKHRLVGRYGQEIGQTYRVVGEPADIDGARELAKTEPFQFQAWALGLVGARLAGSDRKGGDKGIDGRLYFHEGGSETRQIVFSVKAGHLVPNYVRDLRGVIEREKAEIGVLLSFEEPSAGMRAEAAEAGFYESPWGKHPRIQLRTVGQLLDGQGIDYPHVTGANVTHRRAVPARPDAPEALELFKRAAEPPEDYQS